MTRREKFRDRDYRAAYAENALDTYIATQLRVLREQRELTQGKLADLANMKQSRISTMEDVNYAGWSISTLKRLARAFDLSLMVKFESFGGLLREMDAFNRQALERPSFEDDPAFSAGTIEGTSHEDDSAEPTSGRVVVRTHARANVIDAVNRFGIHRDSLNAA